jgi:putative transposase
MKSVHASFICIILEIAFSQSARAALQPRLHRHYNRGRPHSSLEPGIPEPPPGRVPASVHRHVLPLGYRVKSKPLLGGLHHEYRLEKEVA